MDRVVCASLICFGLAACATPVEAKGIILITHGDTIAEMGPLLPEVSKAIRDETKGNFKIGFKYSYFGIFWLDLWTFSGEYCLVDGNSYEPVKEEDLPELTGKTASEIGKPIGYRAPPLLIILAVAGLGLVLIKAFKKPRQPLPPEQIKQLPPFENEPGEDDEAK